jgi:hypothetical protein
MTCGPGRRRYPTLPFHLLGSGSQGVPQNSPWGTFQIPKMKIPGPKRCSRAWDRVLHPTVPLQGEKKPCGPEQ